MPGLVFFPGVHDPHMLAHLPRACFSITRITRRSRKSSIRTGQVLLDSGAFSELALHGRYRHSSAEYAAQLWQARRLMPGIVCAVAQDYMCEPFMLEKTGLTLDEHQRLTIERYDELIAVPLPFPVMPVVQGYLPRDYVKHVTDYGSRLVRGAWVGVGSVCKRNTSPAAIVAVLTAIQAVRPDLRLHGFGVKLTSLRDGDVRRLLYSADSMAWSYSARKQGRNGNAWQEAKAFADRIALEQTMPPGSASAPPPRLR